MSSFPSSTIWTGLLVLFQQSKEITLTYLPYLWYICVISVPHLWYLSHICDIYELWAGVGLLVLYNIFKEEYNYIRPFVVIGNSNLTSIHTCWWERWVGMRIWKCEQLVPLYHHWTDQWPVPPTQCPQQTICLAGPVLIGGGFMTIGFSVEVKQSKKSHLRLSFLMSQICKVLEDLLVQWEIVLFFKPFLHFPFSPFLSEKFFFFFWERITTNFPFILAFRFASDFITPRKECRTQSWTTWSTLTRCSVISFWPFFNPHFLLI